LDEERNLAEHDTLNPVISSVAPTKRTCTIFSRRRVAGCNFGGVIGSSRVDRAVAGGRFRYFSRAALRDLLLTDAAIA